MRSPTHAAVSQRRSQTEFQPTRNKRRGVRGIRLGPRKASRIESTLALPFRVANGEPCVFAGPPDDGTGAIELVPAIRPQSADVCTEHLLGKTARLSKGGATHLSFVGPG